MYIQLYNNICIITIARFTTATEFFVSYFHRYKMFNSSINIITKLSVAAIHIVAKTVRESHYKVSKSVSLRHPSMSTDPFPI